MPDKKEEKIQKKLNLYTAIRTALAAGPHKDTGNNNFYTVLGLKPKKKKK